MPNYTYFCKDCDHEWNETKLIAEREEPTKLPCPKCWKTETIAINIGAPLVGDSVRLGLTKPSGEFRELMQNMKKRIPRNNLPDF